MRIEDQRDNLIRRTTELRIMLARARASSAAVRTRTMELLATAAESRESVASTREAFRRDPVSVAQSQKSLLVAQHRQQSESAAPAHGPFRDERDADRHDVTAPAPGTDQRGDCLLRQIRELRRQVTVLAGSIARTEEEIAATFEEMAQSRPPGDASRLRAHAAKARQFAAKERATIAEEGQAKATRRSAATRPPHHAPAGG